MSERAPQVTENLLREITAAIVREVAPERVILFGSHARGGSRPDSDVDLLVVEDRPFGPGRSRREEAARLWRLLARFPVPKDILVYSRDEVARWSGSRNHVIAHALREGRVLHERP
jgi:predicted nucleotidyltransferase